MVAIILKYRKYLSNNKLLYILWVVGYYRDYHSEFYEI